MKKTVSIFLALFMVLAALASCNTPSPTPEESESSSIFESEESSGESSDQKPDDQEESSVDLGGDDATDQTTSDETEDNGQDGGDQGDGDQDGNDSINHTYSDFTSEEKSIFNETVGLVIPFIPNDEYYVEEFDWGTEIGVSFYTLGNTQAEFDAFRNLFSDYTYDGSEDDEYGDAWYYYSKGNVYVDMSFYYYENEYVVDVYVYISTEGGDEGGDTVDPIIDYGTIDAPVTTTYAHNACADLTSGKSSAYPFYVKGTVTKIGETGKYYKNVYFTDGKTEMLIYTINMGEGVSGFKVGDTITAYGYIKNYNGTIEMATYEGSVYVYAVKVESEGGSQGGGNQGGTESDANVITNDGKGLPQSPNGIYDVDFTKGNYVQNVTDQGYYVDGCPTTGSPAVLVIPIEFIDATAASKGYTIENIEKIFNGKGDDTSYYSVHDYFYISSYEKLDLNITVVDSWFRPANDSSYYENATYDYYGDEIEIGDQLVLDEALAYLSTIMDLSEFDSDNNGIIDAVVMVNTLDIGDNNFHWAYRYWNVYTDDEGYYFEYDSVSANDYLWISYEFVYEGYDENGDVNYDSTNPLNPYTFIHEFGHALGADDYYDTEYNQDPLGGYDVMDSFAGDHNPYSKFNYGWITSSKLIVTDSSVTVTLDPFAKNGDTVIFGNHWDESLGAYQEYYVVMYYTGVGLNSGEGGYFGRDGILVYHVNSSLYAEDYDGETCYDVYNTNSTGEYGTENNLIEFVLSGEGHYTYAEGDSLPELTLDSGESLIYTFTVDSIAAESATLTFTKK